jgi:hypothetical protein
MKLDFENQGSLLRQIQGAEHLANRWRTGLLKPTCRKRGLAWRYLLTWGELLDEETCDALRELCLAAVESVR